MLVTPEVLAARAALLPEDADPQETAEWLESLEAVIRHQGPDRARFLLDTLLQVAARAGAKMPVRHHHARTSTPSPPRTSRRFPGDRELERSIKSLVRWNAMAMVLRANKNTNVGGHISTFASAATLYEIGFNHFFRGRTESHPGDVVFFQGHASPGMYARAYLEGRLTDQQLDQLPPGAPARRRAVELPAPVADAGLLAVPDGQHGPRADHGASTTPGSTATCATAGWPRPTTSGSGRSSATASATSRRSLGCIGARRPGEARQPDLGHQLQPPAARRPGPRQRQDHPGAGGHLPRGRVERHQGRLGQRLGPAPAGRPHRGAGPADDGGGGRRVPGVRRPGHADAEELGQEGPDHREGGHRAARGVHPRALLQHARN